MADDFRERRHPAMTSAHARSAGRALAGGSAAPEPAPASRAAPRSHRSSQQRSPAPGRQRAAAFRPAPAPAARRAGRWGDAEAVPPPPPGIRRPARMSALRSAGTSCPAPRSRSANRRRALSHDAAGARVGRPRPAVSARNPQAEAAKIRLHELLIEELEHGALEGLAPEQQREAVMRAARELIAAGGHPASAAPAATSCSSRVADEVLGLGPLEPLLRDPPSREVMVNDPDKIFFEKRRAASTAAPSASATTQHIMRIIERIVAPLGRRIDESSPDGRRPPAGRLPRQHHHPARRRRKRPTITIRKFRADKMTHGRPDRDRLADRSDGRVPARCASARS